MKITFAILPLKVKHIVFICGFSLKTSSPSYSKWQNRWAYIILAFSIIDRHVHKRFFHSQQALQVGLGSVVLFYPFY